MRPSGIDIRPISCCRSRVEILPSCRCSSLHNGIPLQLLLLARLVRHVPRTACALRMYTIHHSDRIPCRHIHLLIHESRVIVIHHELLVPVSLLHLGYGSTGCRSSVIDVLLTCVWFTYAFAATDAFPFARAQYMSMKQHHHSNKKDPGMVVGTFAGGRSLMFFSSPSSPGLCPSLPSIDSSSRPFMPLPSLSCFCGRRDGLGRKLVST